MNEELRFINRPPLLTNLRINPGLRCKSRLYTSPSVWTHNFEFYPKAQLKYVHNNSEADKQLLIHLNDAKNVFSIQLPNMGSNYVTRLVFDFNAFTVIILHKGQVKAGICSRVFEEEKFIEIAFCAVDSTLQGGGYGRLAMNYLKSHLLYIQIFDIMTCADNDAVTYFKKQGFNDKQILLDPKRWVGRIKDYEGVTLVHCPIDPIIDYMNFNYALNQQIKLISQLTGSHFKTNTLYSKHKPLFPLAPYLTSIPLSQVYKFTELHPTEETEKEADSIPKPSELRRKLIEIERILSNDSRFEIFQRPVTELIAPGYFNTIKRPMDFWTIKKKLSIFDDYYKRPEQFIADIEQIIFNCKSFNSNTTPFYKTAATLQTKLSTLKNGVL